MDLKINPGKPLVGEIQLPGDKSISHRAALFAAMAEGESHIENFLEAGVTEVMLDILRQLGVVWELNRGGLTVSGRGLPSLDPPAEVLNCGSSGTTMRLLAGALTAANLPAVLDGSPGLRKRPMTRIVAPLQSMGALIASTVEGTAPLLLFRRPSGSGLHGAEHRLAAASAQVKTALLLAGLRAEGPTIIFEPGESRDHSERLLASMGVQLDIRNQGGENRVTLHPPEDGRLKPFNTIIPGDFSSAAFLIVGALVTPGSEILIKNVGLNPTRIGLIDVLETMGAKITITHQAERGNEPVGNIHVCHSELKGVRVSGDIVVRMIDEFPIFAVAAAYARGETTVSQALELRYKESDRIASMSAQLREVGVNIEESKDGFIIQGKEKPDGGVVQANGDHRLAMAMAVCGLAAKGKVTVRDAEIYKQSFPDFDYTLATLGADLSYD